jgi:hypothetical protein
MARKGDIDSKSVASRVPMKVFIRLQTKAYESNKTMSAFICDVLSDENFSQGGETKIEYRDILVPKIEYRDRIIEKEVPVEYHHDKIVDNPKLIEENEDLKRQVKLLQKELNKLKEKRKEYLEPNHIAMARIEVRDGTASEKVIQMIKEIDSKK